LIAALWRSKPSRAEMLEAVDTKIAAALEDDARTDNLLVAPILTALKEIEERENRIDRRVEYIYRVLTRRGGLV
jgi:hypothetical protein